MNKFQNLPKDIQQYPVLARRGVSDSSEFSSLSGTSFMYVDKSFESGYTDEVWDKEDLVGPDADEEETEQTLARFQKVLVLWFE